MAVEIFDERKRKTKRALGIVFAGEDLKQSVGTVEELIAWAEQVAPGSALILKPTPVRLFV